MHYTRKFRRFVNQRRIDRKAEMFRKYVKDPIVQEGIRLDTVFTAENGDFVYGYLHTFRTEPLLKKVTVTIKGELFADGEIVAHLPESDDLDFYISTLSSFLSAGCMTMQRPIWTLRWVVPRWIRPWVTMRRN